MAVKTLLSLVGGSSLPGIQLAVNTDWPKDKGQGTNLHQTVAGINASAGLTTILSLTGKYIIQSLWMTLLSTNDVALVKLTVDSVVVWNVDPLTNSATEYYIGQQYNVDKGIAESIICESTFLFEMQMDSDTSIRVDYHARPIL